MIVNGGMDPRIGNQRHQRLVQQIMGQYTAKKQAQARVGSLGGISGAGPAAGAGLLNKFAKRSAGPNVTNPMALSITAALRNALGPGGAGIPGAHEHSYGQGQGADFNYGPQAGYGQADQGYNIPGSQDAGVGAPGGQDPYAPGGPPIGTQLPQQGSGSPFTGGAPGGTISGDPEHNAWVQGFSEVDPFNVGGANPNIDPATGLPYDAYGGAARGLPARTGGRNYAF